MEPALIRGDGLTAWCCLRLLSRAGVPAHLDPGQDRPRIPALMIGETAQRILCDIFDDGTLFDGLPSVRRRVSAWGAAPVTVPHAAVVIPERDLLDRVRQRTPVPPAAELIAPAWTIHTSRPLPSPAREEAFGSRKAAASLALLHRRASAETCWAEAMKDGWLFLLPVGEGRAWLLAVGAPRETLLASSELVQAQLDAVQPVGGEFSCHPRIADPVAGSGWLACGTAAAAFDPLCGDGSGYAARGAILASAVVAAASRGENAASLIGHYQRCLLGGFERHLEACLGFYGSGVNGEWWQRESEALRRGLAWRRQRAAPEKPFAYRLKGFGLEAAD